MADLPCADEARHHARRANQHFIAVHLIFISRLDEIYCASSIKAGSFGVWSEQCLLDAFQSFLASGLFLMYQRSLAIVISPPLPISLLDSLEGKILDQYCRHHDDEKLSRRRYYVEDLNEIEIEYDQTLVDLIDARDDSCPIARVLRQDADGKQIGDEIDFDVIELETVLQSLVANSNGQLERIVVEYGWYSDCATAGQIGGAAAIITRDCINRHSVWDWVRDVLIAAGTTVDSLAAR